MKHHHHQEKASYTTLVVVLLSVVALSIAAQYWMGVFTLQNSVRFFMAFFFLLFGSFKVADVSGFAGAFAEYDPLAKRSAMYAKFYPFLELALGIFYLFALYPAAVNLVTAFVMTLTAAGIMKTLSQKKRIRCACLGSVVKLPMTTISLIEVVLMGLMAIAMLVFMAV